MVATTEVITDWVPRVPKEKRTPAYKLFHYRYMCRVAQVHLLTKEYLEQFGVITSGDPKIDRELARAPIDIQITPAGMAEMLDEGVSITLINPEDSKVIYETIYEHLKDWQSQVRLNPHINTAPTDDLRKFDALAAEIYPIARYYWRGKPYHGTFFQFLDNMGRGAQTRNVGKPAKLSQADVRPPTHQPMAESILQPLRDRSKPWRGG